MFNCKDLVYFQHNGLKKGGRKFFAIYIAEFYFKANGSNSYFIIAGIEYLPTL